MVRDKALRLRELITKTKASPLEEPDRSEFEKLRRSLAEGYSLAQKLTLKPGQLQRRSRRVAHMLKLTITARSTEKTATMNLSTGGFAALLAEPPGQSEVVDFTLGTSLGSVEGRARVVSLVPRDRGWLTSFAIEEASEAARAKLDVVVLEQVVAGLAK
jgi:hypothetical protein